MQIPGEEWQRLLYIDLMTDSICIAGVTVEMDFFKTLVIA